MNVETRAPTLLDDWTARRERLAGLAEPRGPYVEMHLALLDYLIRRYRGSPEAARPALYPIAAGLYVNDRAIVVHHRLFKDAVAGVKTPLEAQGRVRGLVQRIVRDTAADEPQAEPGLVGPEPDDLIPPASRAETAGWWRRVSPHLRLGCRSVRLVRAPVEPQAHMPESFLSRLYERLGDPHYEVPDAVELMLDCENPSGPRYAVRAWHDRIARGSIDSVTLRMGELFCRPRYAARVLRPAREGLAHPSVDVRLVTMELLGRIGDLDDVGLLSDLLALPPQSDEHSQERPRLLTAIRRITERHSGETDLNDLARSWEGKS